MGMKLMPKKEINSAAAAVRKSEIDEGHKLAKQISGIRETKAQEEVSLEKFRCETIKNIQEELVPLQRELEDVKKEVVEAKKVRNELLVPLDKEWIEVKSVLGVAEKEREDALEASKLLQEELESVVAERVKAERTTSRLLTLEKVAQDCRDSAIIIEREAQEMRETADNTNRESDALKRATEVHVTEEHRKLTMREETMVEKEQRVEEDRIDIEKEKVRLEDERQTLDRAFNRLKKTK